jgi:hypothetical protein
MKIDSRLTTVFTVVFSALLLGGSIATAEEAYAPPTAEQVNAIAKDPALLKGFIEKASVEQTADLVVRVMAAIEASDATAAGKQAAVGRVFNVVYDVKGEEADEIIARVRKKVNPRLLPIIRSGITLPSSSPLYRRQ